MICALTSWVDHVENRQCGRVVGLPEGMEDPHWAVFVECFSSSIFSPSLRCLLPMWWNGPTRFLLVLPPDPSWYDFWISLTGTRGTQIPWGEKAWKHHDHVVPGLLSRNPEKKNTDHSRRCARVYDRKARNTVCSTQVGSEINIRGLVNSLIPCMKPMSGWTPCDGADCL